MNSSACSHTESEEAKSLASPAGRKIGKAPHFRASVSISSESELTQTESILRALLAWRMDHASSGRPQKGARFFRGMPLDPPRAGITETVWRSDTQ